MDQIKKIPGEKEIPSIQQPSHEKITPKLEPPHQESTIEPAEKIEKKKGPVTAYPELPFPFYQVIDLTKFLEIIEKVKEAAPASQKLEASMSQVVSTMIDAWAESLYVQNERQRRDLTIQRQTEDLKAQLRREKKHVDKKEDVDKAAQASLLLGGLLLAGFAPNFQQLAMTSLAPVAQALQAISVTGMAPLAFTGLVGLVAAGVVIQSSLLTLTSKAKGKQAINASFIESYAQRILSTINNKELDTTLLQLCSAKGKEADLHLQQVKLVLLATALALAYRAETKWISKEEFADIVGPNPTITFKEGDVRNDLIGAFRAILESLPPKERILLMQKLEDYFESKPTLEKLLEPNQVAVELFSSQVTPLTPV